ncbi:hypothetical protein ABG067_001193 [Albugo candida]
MQNVMDKIEDIWNEDGKLQSDIVMNYCNILRDGRRNLEDKMEAIQSCTQEQGENVTSKLFTLQKACDEYGANGVAGYLS